MEAENRHLPVVFRTGVWEIKQPTIKTEQTPNVVGFSPTLSECLWLPAFVEQKSLSSSVALLAVGLFNVSWVVSSNLPEAGIPMGLASVLVLESRGGLEGLAFFFEYCPRRVSQADESSSVELSSVKDGIYALGKAHMRSTRLSEVKKMTQLML